MASFISWGGKILINKLYCTTTGASNLAVQTGKIHCSPMQEERN